ncbi:MAG: polyprenyl synthetase family protein [Solirubrobacterales bacterium]
MNGSAVPPPVTVVMEAAEAWLPRLMGQVEARLAELVAGHGESLGADAGATLAAGGKRLRPMLVLLCAGPDAGPGAIRAATAVELVHMATLVHDDVLDAAPLRRGRPTVVATSGTVRATAVGDLLFSRAFAELAEVPIEAGDDAAAAGTARSAGERRVALLAGASVALALGELAQRRDAFVADLSPERYMARCLLKTARLFECACSIGRDDAGADAALIAFGREIGLAFQLLDDVLDISGPPERTGKARGTDLLDGTVTLPLIAAIREDPSLAEVDLRALDSSTAAAVCDRIAATGALERVRSDARGRVASAKQMIGSAPLPAKQRELLALVADGVVDRYA